jgi:phage shock protein PspC (stress-responsive transcriptional regulator)
MKKLYKSRTDKMISGICGGMAKYFGIDPTIVRIAWAVFTVLGAGILAYIVCIFVIPDEPLDAIQTSPDVATSKLDTSNSMRIVFAVIVIIVGLSLLFGNLSLGWVSDWVSKLFWPLLLIGIGAVIIFTVTKNH